jgi:hypothetical protein
MSIINQFYKHLNSGSHPEFGITAQLKIVSTSIFSIIKPFSIFADDFGFYNKDNFVALVQTMFLHESTLRNSSEFNEVRMNFVSFPGFPSTPTGNLNNRFKDNISQVSQIIQRVPVSLTIWFPMHIIAFDIESRTLFQSLICSDIQLPILLKELFLRTRISTIGSYFIKPKLDTSDCDLFYSSVDFLKDTFLDYKYLRTKEGMLNYIAYLTLLSESRYCKTFDSSIIRDISITSGFTITQLAISVSESCSNLVHVMQGNSFPNGSPTFVHFLDAIISCQKQYDENNVYSNTSFSPFVSFEGINQSSTAKWIVHRSLGHTTNSSFPHEPHEEIPILTDELIAKPVLPTVNTDIKKVRKKNLKSQDFNKFKTNEYKKLFELFVFFASNLSKMSSIDIKKLNLITT